MTWWQPWTWFPPSSGPGGWVKVDGHDTIWARASLPIAVYIDRDAERWWHDIEIGLLWANSTVGRRMFMAPESPIYAVAQSFRPDVGTNVGVPGALYITTADDVERDHGDTDVRADQRTGEIRNVYMRLGRQLTEMSDQVFRHELGHAMGLDHSAGLMARKLTRDRPQWMIAEDVARLRGAYLEG